MITILGIVVIVTGLIAWIGQTLAFVAPKISIKLGLTEPEDEIDRTLYIVETKANALPDLLHRTDTASFRCFDADEACILANIRFIWRWNIYLCIDISNLVTHLSEEA